MRAKSWAKLAVFFLLVAFVLHGMYSYHWFAPPNPYGPCPAGSHYTNFWFPPGNPNNNIPVQAGVKKWFGSTEIASCSGSVQIGLNS